MKKIILSLIISFYAFNMSFAQCPSGVNFTYTSLCTGSGVDFTNTSNVGKGAAYSYSWDFDRGGVGGVNPTTSTQENPTGIIFSNSTSYDVRLTITEKASGCKSNKTRTITLNQTPSANFDADTSKACTGMDVNFQNTGTGGGGFTYAWDFGTGASPATSNNENPNKIQYSSSGVKTIQFTITGCGTSVKTKTINIYKDADANFTTSLAGSLGCIGEGVNVYNAGTSSGGTFPITYSWDFGSTASPTTSSLENPTGIAYSTSGAKNINHIVTTGGTMSCSQKNKSITITINPSPSVSFSSTAPVCINKSVDFTATGDTGVGYTYFWDFGAGASPATSTAKNPKGVVYSIAGTKTVTLTVGNQFLGCITSATQNITINATPVASFTSTAPKCTGLNVDFINTGTTTGVSYAWNFGSGANPATSTSQSPTGVVYSTSGIKTVTLTVTNTTTNCAVTATNTITIYQTPSVSFSSTAPVCVNTGINFTNKGSTGSNWSYNWTFGKDANPSTSTSESPTGVYYINSGTKRVTFTISDQNCTNTYSDTSVVINATPVASFTSTAPRCTGLMVDFTNTGTTNGVTYSWNFGSGATPTISAAQNPTGVVYSTSGIKTVTLTTTNSTTGCAVTATNTIEIYQTPSVSFTSSTPVCVSTGANFTNTGSTGINWSYSWSFGKDASPSSSTSESPKGVLFGSGGTKIVTFTISDQNCTNTDSTHSITINVLPVVDAGKDTTICANTSVQIGTTTVNNYTYSWFPSNTLDNAQIANPTSSPIAPVTKYIVTVTDKTSGCQNTDSVAVTMLTPLIANAGVDVEICRYDSIQIGTGLVKGQTYSWAPVKGINSTVSPNPMVSPDTTTTYTLTVTGANCASVKDQVTVIVHPLPLANAGKDTMIARGANVQLEATGGTQYVWTPATGLSNAGIYNPIASPLDSTIYKLTVTDVYGCVNSDTMTIKVITPSHWVPNAFTPDNQDNNIFYVRGEGMTNFEFGIFNRWGEQLFYTKDASQGWDGKKQISGEDLPAGAYIYYIKGKTTTGDPINETGLINLIR